MVSSLTWLFVVVLFVPGTVVQVLQYIVVGKFTATGAFNRYIT